MRRLSFVIERKADVRVVQTTPNMAGVPGPISAVEWAKSGSEVPGVSKGTENTLRETFIRKWRPINLGE